MTMGTEQLMESLRTISDRFEQAVETAKQAGMESALDDLTDIVRTLSEALPHVERALGMKPNPPGYRD
jgi:hypothetical protein